MDGKVFDFSSSNHNLSMLYNYIKIAFRALTRNRTFSIINILGLVIGISFSCMLYVYVQHELTYDSFHIKSNEIYRVLTIDKRTPDHPRTYGITVPAMGDEMVRTFPEVTDRVRLHRFVGQVVFEIDGQNFQERNWFTTDANFFDVFDFEFKAGNRSTALKEPHSLVLTESAAKKYFGNSDPLGKVIDQTSFGSVKVTGVIKDIPDNSHLQFDFLFSRVVPDSTWSAYLNSWKDFEAFTYIVLNKQSDFESVKAKMPAFEKEHFGFAQGMVAIDFQPLKDIYLNSSQIEQSIQSQYGQLSYIYIFGSIGLFMLFIACINYINMATSKAMSRAREIGARKVAGAAKRQLVIQFLTESFVVAFVAMILSVGLMDFCLPYFNEITGKKFDITTDNLQQYLYPLLGLTILIALLSGSYPAFYLARLKPVSSLKGKLVMNTGRVRLREALVVFQFALTVIMIVSTLVVGEQLKYIREKDMGYDKDQLMVIDINSGNVREKFEAMKNEYAKIPGISSVAVSSRVPGEWKNIVQLYGKTPQRADSVQTYFMGFDEDMLETYRFHLAEGSYFPHNQLTDSTHIILNESAVKAFALEQPIGATISLNGNGGKLNATVIGVLKDFNFQSLHQKVAPIVIGAWNNPIHSIDYFTLKINGNREDVIAAATAVHNQFDQHTPIEYHFLNEQLNSYYQAEVRAGQIFRMGGVLSIFVACLGLFGLATYNIERRMKEMGIRKVLGATGANLFMLLSSSFAMQVGIAFVLAAPLAYFIMTEWLDAFAYRTSIHSGIFFLAGLMVLAIALLTISYRTLQAVYANPVKSLKEE